MKIDIIIPVFGNLPVVKQCFESLYPLPEGWNVIVYDSKVSEIDGTKQYLIEQQKIKNFTLLDDNRILSHPDAMQLLFDNTKSDWILHLDSDVELKNKDFFKWAEYVVTFDRMKVWGKYQHYGTYLVPHEGSEIFHLPRMHAHVLLFEKKFVIDRNIIFDTMIISGKLIWGRGILSNTKKPVDHRSNINPKVVGDTAWHLYLESHSHGVCGDIPNNIWRMWDHKEASSRNWAVTNASEITKLRSDKL